ncbi:hypothetical protein L596_018301 [Steinernema carpocapsae]|uniref:Uncharacterized protein n=1 Tax=Steinernema carpocapsae TaxID=34508 RepID=A0A4U5N4P6_STECR|nr:hypothetical protein L596_018301 [Steinernema carpocapsae]
MFPAMPSRHSRYLKRTLEHSSEARRYCTILTSCRSAIVYKPCEKNRWTTRKRSVQRRDGRVGPCFQKPMYVMGDNRKTK